MGQEEMESYGMLSRTVALLVLLVGTFVAGTVPLFVLKKLRATKGQQRGKDGVVDQDPVSGSKVISFLMCFGGGVLFSTCFVHLLPEVRESFVSYTRSNGSREDTGGQEEHQFPLPEFLICAGFLSVYFVEEILHAALGHYHGPREVPESHGHSHSPVVLTCYSRDAELTASGRKVSNGEAKYGSTDNHAAPPVVTTVFQHDHQGGEFESDTMGLKKKEASENALSNQERGAGPHGHSHGLGPTGEAVKISLGGLLIVVALSFHSIFEGLAIGLQNSNRDVWTMLIAVAIHKFVIAFVVGLEVCAEGARVAVLVTYMVVFAFMSPIGIVIGMLSQMSLVGTWDIVIGYMNALATGTLLYVTFFEVLQREKNSRLLGIYQFVAVTVGFVFMTVVSYFSE